MGRWNESHSRQLLYRSIVKSRVELERRTGGRNGFQRALALPARSNLSWLAAVYGSDKGATAHRYVDLYERHLAPVRRRVHKVLEIGIYRGASLRMWRDYFANAEVFGVDIKPVVVDGPRIQTICGDQSDPDLLRRVAALGPFDLIIDDGSHQADQQLATFDGLFGAVTPGGFYVIEDMQTAYRAEYGGGPPGSADTAVTLIQRLVDAVNREHIGDCPQRDAATLVPVEALHVYAKIAFVQRARRA